MVASAFTSIALYLLAGVLAARLRLVPEATARVLNAIVLYALLPALVLNATEALHFEHGWLPVLSIPWWTWICAGLVVLMTARALALDRPTTGCLLLCAVLGNTAYLGYPVISAVYGPQGLPTAVVYDQLGTFLQLAVFGPFVVARYGAGGAPGLRQVLGRILGFPAFLALLVGLLPWSRPPLLSAVLSAAAGLLVPLAVFAVGLNLRLTLPPAEQRALVLGLGVKLVLMPAAALLAALLLALPEAPRAVLVVQAAMPPMVTAGLLAGAAGLAPRLAAAMVGVGIVLGLPWLMLLATWLR